MIKVGMRRSSTPRHALNDAVVPDMTMNHSRSDNLTRRQNFPYRLLHYLDTYQACCCWWCDMGGKSSWRFWNLKCCFESWVEGSGTFLFDFAFFLDSGRSLTSSESFSGNLSTNDVFKTPFHYVTKILFSYWNRQNKRKAYLTHFFFHRHLLHQRSFWFWPKTALHFFNRSWVGCFDGELLEDVGGSEREGGGGGGSCDWLADVCMLESKDAGGTALFKWEYGLEREGERDPPAPWWAMPEEL